MFTIEQIRQAHAKVKSGADFPAYMREIKALGVLGYDAYVADGRIDYFGAEGYTTSAPAKYDRMDVAGQSDIVQFRKDLKDHQQGLTDYLTFCRDCARSGVEKWIIDMDRMTCAYYDKAGNELLIENIPQ
ncbi:DUF1398 domain-containing protein [Sphingobacterium spiritivorum]|uniref:DUF1398 domain-containing protein n=1 Tax=Sphingobacterium spiritivorum TaxID=258 RepID=UPI00191910F4|nr:DUF1398 family protein [Sphingobacterium spiritivorum]QQT26685.1 DUF1398 domain-containing protein [Sphingobacterium spiritivorum]